MLAQIKQWFTHLLARLVIKAPDLHGMICPCPYGQS